MRNRGLIRPGLLLLVTAALLVPASAFALPAGNEDDADSKQYYVSLGDSYAAGFQVTADGLRATDEGYAEQIVPRARKRGHRFELVNFGCGGASTTSILTAPGCGAPAVDGAPYGGLSQAAAAEEFLREHEGEVGLVTVSIGGNDVTGCVADPDPIGCVARAVVNIQANVSRLAAQLRAAAGPDVPIIGLTYPDVILGQWVHPPVSQGFAQLSVVAFEMFINPTLATAYESGDSTFVNVTEETGAYGSLERTTELAPYGTIPVPVARVCKLTYYCELGDIHAKTAGYQAIAKLVVATLPRV
jgi:lysophospholipase L1-like esterase